MIELSLKTLAIINSCLLTTLLLLFLYLLIQKDRELKRKTRKENLKNKIRQPLFAYLNEGVDVKTRLFQRDPVSFEAVQELLYEYRSMTKGEEVGERIQRFAIDNFTDYYRKLLQHHRWSIRMNTLYLIEDFMMISLEEDILEKLDDTSISKVERYQQLRVLAKLQSNHLFSYLLIDSFVYPLFLYKEILRNLKIDHFDQMVSKYDTACDELKIAILALFAEKRDTSYLPLVERELENGHLDIRLQALKVVRSFGYISNFQLLYNFAKSSLWQERMLFAQITSVIQKERFKPLLTQLLTDESWWVRNAAGDALCSYQDGRFILFHIAQTSNDNFARDMAWQCLGGKETS